MMKAKPRFRHHLILLICIQIILSAAVNSEIKGEKIAEIRLLIVDGFSNHDWQRTTRSIINILDDYKGFLIDVTTSPDNLATKDQMELWNPDFSLYDVVLINCNDLKAEVNWSISIKKNLENYVSGGGGLYIFHSANNAFENWEEYNKMIGLGWRNKNFGKAVTIEDDGTLKIIEAGDGENTSHGPRVNALVTRIDNHPIHKGMPEKWMYADIEIYTYARGPLENVTILTFSKDELYKKNFPVEWVVKYGKGKVYNSSLGHFWGNQQNPEGIRCAAFQTVMVRALQWLADRKVDKNLPDDFPGVKDVSLRNNIFK